MIKKTHLKECLNKAFNNKENNKTIFRYTVKSNIDINNSHSNTYYCTSNYNLIS